MKHTPGPWRPSPWGESFSIDSMSVDQSGIAFVNPMGCRSAGIASAQDKANASLIACAPELLEACKGMLADLRVLQGIMPTLPSMAAAVAAIAKAEKGGSR